ncbi:MAG: transporter related [Mahella sp.]|nr:transporter related [Mahella sp.]
MIGMIELKNVAKNYGLSALGLYSESAIINTGEIVGILGENGSGKTTMLKAIMGLCDIQYGEILIDGRPVFEQYDRMAFITCEGSYFPNMTPYEYGNFLAEFFPSFDMDRYWNLIKFFDLDYLKKIKTFSAGQKAKLEVSAGFSKGAKYILMDEPFLGSDMFTRRDFLKLLVSDFREDETILISTHFIDEIENIIDRAIILRYGRIKADFYIDDIKNQGKTLADIMTEVKKVLSKSKT